MKNTQMTYRTADLQKLEEDLIRGIKLRIAEFKQNGVALEILPSQNKMEWFQFLHFFRS